jgi:hypothetical protein
MPELVGGCPGHGGGPGTPPETPPGGAIYLFSEGEVHIIGTVMASGAGGRGGTMLHGGDGGGAGGSLILEGVVDIFVEGQLYAVGGNGGGGGDLTGLGHVGDDGGDANGNGGVPAANGGFGGTFSEREGDPGGPGGGGGGGAGGDGVIYLIGASSVGTLIPEPIMIR